MKKAKDAPQNVAIAP